MLKYGYVRTDIVGCCHRQEVEEEKEEDDDHDGKGDDDNEGIADNSGDGDDDDDVDVDIKGKRLSFSKVVDSWRFCVFGDPKQLSEVSAFSSLVFRFFCAIHSMSHQ